MNHLPVPTSPVGRLALEVVWLEASAVPSIGGCHGCACVPYCFSDEE